MTHPTGGTCGIMHRDCGLVLTIPQGTALTVLVPMSDSVPQPAARRLPQPTHRTDILCSVYISTLLGKCQLGKIGQWEESERSWKGEGGVWEGGRKPSLLRGSGCKVSAGKSTAGLASSGTRHAEAEEFTRR